MAGSQLTNPTMLATNLPKQPTHATPGQPLPTATFLPSVPPTPPHLHAAVVEPLVVTCVQAAQGRRARQRAHAQHSNSPGAVHQQQGVQAGQGGQVLQPLSGDQAAVAEVQAAQRAAARQVAQALRWQEGMADARAGLGGQVGGADGRGRQHANTQLQRAWQKQQHSSWFAKPCPQRAWQK